MTQSSILLPFSFIFVFGGPRRTTISRYQNTHKYRGSGFRPLREGFTDDSEKLGHEDQKRLETGSVAIDKNAQN